jgi:hypothetical protein
MLPASMLGDYSTTASSMHSYFLHLIDIFGNQFIIMSLLGHPARHDALIL